MTRTTAALSIAGRRRLDNWRTQPIAHVATEMGISRACTGKGQSLASPR